MFVRHSLNSLLELDDLNLAVSHGLADSKVKLHGDQTIVAIFAAMDGSAISLFHKFLILRSLDCECESSVPASSSEDQGGSV